jgi:hypothetical protein
LNGTISRWEKLWKFSMKACGIALGADPGRLFHERAVERQHFFNLHRDCVIHFAPVKSASVSKRLAGMFALPSISHVLQQKLHLVSVWHENSRAAESACPCAR